MTKRAVVLLTRSACDHSDARRLRWLELDSSRQQFDAHGTSQLLGRNEARQCRRHVRRSDDPPPQASSGHGQVRCYLAICAQVKDLAARIEAAQDPEVMKMTGWPGTWGQAMPPDMTGMADMPGMMSTADPKALQASTGAAFDMRFLTMMIAHHTGALTMAKAELSGGSDPDAKALAQLSLATGWDHRVATT